MDTAAVTMKQYTYDARRRLRIHEYRARSFAGAGMTTDDIRRSGVGCDTGSAAGVTCTIYGSGIALNYAETNGTSAVTYGYIACVACGATVEDHPHRLFLSSFEYYYGYRYYNPGLGRWLSRDPIGEKGGMNLYYFVNNSPCMGRDSLGLSASTRVVRQEAGTVAELITYLGVTVRQVGRDSAGYKQGANEIWIGSAFYDSGAGWITDVSTPYVGVVEDDAGNKLYSDYAMFNATIAHEVVSAVFMHFEGYHEFAGPGTPRGVYATGVHQLAIVLEWGVWAKEREAYLTCEEAKRRQNEANASYAISSRYSWNQRYVDELGRLTDWICACRCGTLSTERQTYTSLKYEKTNIRNYRRDERIQMQSEFTCTDRKISGDLEVKLETR